MQPRKSEEELPRYLPFPFMPAIAATALYHEGHQVLLLDAVAENNDHQQTRQRIKDFAPDLVFAEVSSPSLAHDLRALKKLKQFCGASPVLVCGGMHTPEMVPAMLNENAFIDFWLAGEYETTLPALVKSLAKNEQPPATAGLMTAGSSPVEPFFHTDLGNLPRPLYEQLPMGNYSDPVCGLPCPTAISWLSRGCPFGCSFCVWPQVVYGNRTYRTRPIEQALDEVVYQIGAFGCESFYFDDDTANIDENRVLELCDRIRQRGLNIYPWSMMARADCMTRKMIDALAGAGLYSIKYGVESISPDLTDACSKKTNSERFHKAIALTAKAGIKMHLTFMFGLPGETPESIKQTTDFCIQIAPESAQFSFCTPFPGTALYDECKKNGWLTTEDWSEYLGTSSAVINTPQLSAAELEEGTCRAEARWQQACRMRLMQRQNRLIEELSKRSERTTWAFMGDKKFAGFLFNSRQAEPLFDQYREKAENNSLIVIISQHDEEKIYRQLIRRNPAVRNRIIRLYTSK
jgi:radical SAM superfamily enzyme YgiQ (UPF0313 family)